MKTEITTVNDSYSNNNNNNSNDNNNRSKRTNNVSMMSAVMHMSPQNAHHCSRDYVSPITHWQQPVCTAATNETA